MLRNSVAAMTKNLREYIDLVESEQDHPDGTYAEVAPTPKSLRAIESVITKLGIKEPTPSSEIHCTITYSRKPCPSLADYEPQLPVSARIQGFRVFPMQTGGNCLVLELDSPGIEELHEYARRLGCSHDYPEYTPHVTLTYKWPNKELPDMDVSAIKLAFDRFTVKPLRPNYVPGQDE